MGYAIAEELANLGAKVFLISGPTALTTTNKNIKKISVVSANEMFEQSITIFPSCDIAIMSAAVADFTPVISVNQKVKRGKENWNIELKPTKDIAAHLGSMKTKEQLLVGFALETQNEEVNALSKLERKNLDFIVLNSLNDEGAGFGHPTNKITIIDKQNKIDKYELKSKTEVAKDIANKILSYYL